MWWIGDVLAAWAGAALAAWWMRRRLTRALAFQRDQHARRMHSVHAENAQLRVAYTSYERGLTTPPVLQAAAALLNDVSSDRSE